MMLRGGLRMDMVEFIAKLDQYYSLTANYQRLVVLTSTIGCFVGFYFWVYFAINARLFLGLPLGEASLDGRGLKFFLWIVAILIAFPLLCYVAFSIAILLASIPLILRGKISTEEAIGIVVSGILPRSWFRISLDEKKVD